MNWKDSNIKKILETEGPSSKEFELTMIRLRILIEIAGENASPGDALTRIKSKKFDKEE